MDEQPQLIHVGTFPQPHEAHMAQMLLEVEGIESFLEGEYMVSINPLLSNAMGGVRLMVARADAELASHILQEHRRERAAEEARRARTCPACHSEGGAEIHRPLVIGLLVVFTLGVFCLLVPWPRYRCTNCGHRWR